MKTTYSKYKPSGVEWIGEIPEHWEVEKLKYLSNVRGSNVDKHIYETERQVKLLNYTDVYYNDFVRNDLELKNGSCSNEEFEKFKVRKGDVIITKDSETPNDIGIPCFIPEDLENVVCGYHLSMITPNENTLNGGYLFRQIQSKRVRSYFEINSNGITRYGLGKSSIEDTPIILPPLPEQEQIVNFLDEKTSEIDNLIYITEKKIELLKENRTSTINRVITKGLDPHVELKDSGINWIGEIPKHWVYSRLNRFCVVKDGTHDTPEYIDPCETSIPFVTSNSFVDGEIDFSLTKHIKYDDYVEINKRSDVVKGDVIMSMIGSNIGNLVLVKTDRPFSIKNVCLFKTSSSKKITSNYLNLLLQSKQLFYQVDTIQKGGGQKFLSLDDLRSLIFSFPPVQEQDEIVKHLDRIIQEIETLISIEQQRIETLKEYRQSLISEVITGRVRVCNEVI